jgi:asparagine synthase (glutamine-hydrolysing)
MYRYLALVWNPGDERSGNAAAALEQRLNASATGWSRVFQATGVLVVHADRLANGPADPWPGSCGQNGASDAWPLAAAAGVVLGRVFTRNIESPRAAARVTFDDTESSQIIASGCRRLLERYWGRYVAIVRNGITGEVWVLRDPSGGFPCWLTDHEGVAIVCSDIEDCHALGLASFAVNWNYIAGFVAHAGLQIRETALDGVSEVQPGERLRFSSGSMQRSMEWNPIEIARSAPFETDEEAAAALRVTTLGCVHTWAACHKGIVHNLSGGLDSSIVLSCLATAPSSPELVCLNYFGTGPHEDERRYARAMAGRVGVKLVEQQLDPRAVRLQKLLSLRRSPRPWFYVYEIEHGAFEGELAARHGADGLFSGAGGDGVFFQARADLAVTDYFFAHGLGAGLMRTALDAARVSRKSIWPLLWQAARMRILRPEWDPVAAMKPVTRTIVNSEIVEAAKRNTALSHPWLTPSATRGVPPGILWHIMSVSTPPAYYSSFQRDSYPERTMPLLSQPLVELCLRIPTYVLIRSGRDRAVARRSFERDLPTEIVRRQAKGRTDQHLRNILDANLDFVRELLLDGLLVQHGLLERRALELYLTRERSPADFQYTEILQEHACTEAWLRSWATTA